ncbi:MAG TPA: hypothetical protein VGI10_23190 [Polyangiaceae bacterium]
MDRALRFFLGAAHCSLAALFAAPAQAQAGTHVFALIVANNKSSTLSDPDLQYADDDGARYYQLFRSIATADDVALLTSFDRASLAEYKALAPLAQAPTRGALEAASARLAQAVNAARARGEHTAFYFVFAGHGDVDNGRGYLELEDARIDGSFLEQHVIEQIPAETKHMLLDSCNSFFVVNPRKPGGRRWATPKDMALGFSARHPEVGLFLSTNSESEVFEWSQIESGVFSHEVRSGIEGAADVNGDGATSYAELAGFVETANAGITRETLRPHLFYRGPRGDANATLFPTGAMNGRRIRLSAEPARLWIKNASGARFLDLHKERGAVTLVLPAVADQELSVFEELAGPAPLRPVVHERAIAAGSEPVELAATQIADPEVSARGDRIFGSLFSEPYGPLAYAAYLKQASSAPEPVYGLTDTDLARMHNYLTMMAEQDRTTRSGLGVVLLGFGGMAESITLGLALNKHDRDAHPGTIFGVGAAGAALIGGGLYEVLTPATGQRALSTFEQELMASRGDRSYAFVRTEEFLNQMAARERTQREVAFWTMEVLGVATAGLATAIALDPPKDSTNHAVAPALLYSEAVLFGAVGFLVHGTDTPTERLLHLYHEDPTLKLHFGVAPTASGFALGVTGRF